MASSSSLRRRRLLLHHLLLLLLLLLLPSSLPQSLPPSEVSALLELRSILELSPALSSWNSYTPFCFLPNSSAVSLSCTLNATSSSFSLTSLSVHGNRTKSPRQPLSANFSLPYLFSTLLLLPSLRSLTLSSLGLWGPLPASPLPAGLLLLNLSSNYLYGPVPSSLFATTRTLDLSDNYLKGNLPDLSPFDQLDHLDLSLNKLGPGLPLLGSGLTRLILRNNSFKATLPPDLGILTRLQYLDLANNRLLGAIPAALLSLPGIRHVDLSGNLLTGALPASLACGESLEFVELSRNKLVGSLPGCIRSRAAASYAWNCLTGVDSRFQHPRSYCVLKPIAAVLPKSVKDGARAKNGLALMLGIAGGIIGGALLLVLALVVVRRKVANEVKDRDGDAVVLGKSAPPPAGTPSKALADARRVEARGGMFDLKPYRVFTTQEINEMTNNFDPSNLMQESLELKIYRGSLDDGSAVAVKCLRIRQRYSAQSMQKFIDVISKLRHRNLVSVLGHCIDRTEDHLAISVSIYIVFELVSNGTLRSHLTEWRKREMLKWPQRVTAIIGVARGIQFLHSSSAAGMFENNLKIDNILLDKTLSAKIANYNLPKIIISKDKNNKVCGDMVFNPLDGKYVNSGYGADHGDKDDIYQLGLILVEVITGKPTHSSGELETLKGQLQRIVTESSPRTLKGLIDPAIEGTFAFDSLKTTAEVALNCLCKNPGQRPSIDDVLWNLQYSLQIQDALAGTDELSGQF